MPSTLGQVAWVREKIDICTKTAQTPTARPLPQSPESKHRHRCGQTISRSFQKWSTWAESSPQCRRCPYLQWSSATTLVSLNLSIFHDFILNYRDVIKQCYNANDFFLCTEIINLQPAGAARSCPERKTTTEQPVFDANRDRFIMQR